MKKLSLFPVVFTILVINLFCITLVNAQTENKFRRARRPIPNRYIVVLKEGSKILKAISPGALQQDTVSQISNELTTAYGGKIERAFKAALRGYSVTLSYEQALRLSQDSRVKFVEEDSIVYPSQIDSPTTQPGATWGLDRIDQHSLPLNGTYNFSSTGTGVNAYVIDSGIRSTHSEFVGRIGSGTDFVGDGQNGNDCNGHGTHVAGTIGGVTYGVAKNVMLHSVRVFGCTGGASTSTIIAAIDWVTANHILPAVVNMSLGGEGTSTSEQNAINNSMASGITYVVASGNDGANACDYDPAYIPGVITVGASDMNDSRASFSNYGPCVDIFAPGVNITSAGISDDAATAVKTGTSMATPHVAGVVARFLETNPQSSPSVVANSLVSSATSGVIADVQNSPNLLLYSNVLLNTVLPPGPAIIINDSGPATPYPSTHVVSGLQGVIANSPGSLQVNIKNFRHSYPSDSSLLLEGPTGAKILLQGRAGGDIGTYDVSYTISDSGVTQISSNMLVSGGIYKPAALGLPNFPAPGPNTTYSNPGPIGNGTSTFASTFGGTNPNGIWKLYVLDEYLEDGGQIADWSLNITTGPAVPSAPTGVVTNVISTSQINVFWNQAAVNENVSSYNLRINGASVITGINYLSYAVKNLSPNTNYTFEVQAVNSLGAVSAWSAPVSATTNPVAVISPPTNVSPQPVSPNQINVFWNASTSQNIVGYNLRVNGSSIISGITYLSYAVKNLNPNTAYTFEVQAVDSTGAVSAWSASVRATTNPVAPPPDAPTNISPQVVSPNQINLFWNASTSPNVVSYSVRVNGSTIIPDITYLSYAVKNLNSNTTYIFEVQAVNSSGAVSAWSTLVRATTPPAIGAPTTPTGITAQVVSALQVNLFWSQNPANENVTSYNVRVDGSGAITNITYLSYAIRNLSPETTHTFEVQAVNAIGPSAWSAPISARTPNLVPLMPTGVVAQAVSSSQINLFWNQNADTDYVTSYTLRIDGRLIFGVKYLSYAIKDLSPNTSHTFEVQAVNANGASPWSTPVSATTNPVAVPNAPTNVSPQAVSSSQINVFWNASTSPNITSYNLRVNGASVISGITYLSYAVKNLNPNTTYSFEVQAVDSTGSVSAWSAPVSATTNAVVVPNAPTNVAPQVVSATQINVFWNASTSQNIVGYNLRINGSTVIPNITYLSYAVKNLNPNTTYTFEVQAIDSAGAVSAWSTPISIATPASGTATAESNVFEQIWKVITGYWGDQSQTV